MLVSTIILNTPTASGMGSSLHKVSSSSTETAGGTVLRTVERCGTTVPDCNGWNLDDCLREH